MLAICNWRGTRDLLWSIFPNSEVLGSHEATGDGDGMDCVVEVGWDIVEVGGR